jgi:RNA polymerase sigma-70 factor (ECF subfamily)
VGVEAETALRTIAMTAPPDAPDPLQRYCAGRDPEAFSALVAEYRRPVYSYLLRCGVAPEDRDDLFQAIFLKIHRSADQYQSERPAHPWIFTIVANEVRTYWRRRKVRALLFAEPSPREPEDPTPDGERMVAARETVAWLEKEIHGLPLAQREVLILVSLEGRPLAEVAEVLNLPLNTVKTHLRRARLSLCERLARRRAVKPVEERS